MGWFQLDPESVAARVKASGSPAKIPTLGGSVLRGILGFTVVSVAGFAPWALGGAWFHRTIGEGGMYAVCAAAWIAGWMGLHGHTGSLAGLLAGTALMGWIFANAFDERSAALKSIAALF